MGTFSTKKSYRAVDRVARLQRVMDMPFGGAGLGGEIANLANQIIPGVLTAPGVGTVAREAMIPAGNTAPRMGGVIPNPIDTLGRLAQNVGGMLRGDDPEPSMTADQYKASPHFRTEIPFEEGMTESRANALASFYDRKKVAEHFASKRPISSFLGQFVGQALDPINYVPVFGPAAQMAAKARLGTIGGRMLVGSADAAINTAAFSLLTAGMRQEFGDDVSFNAIVSEIGMSALVGGVFSGVAPLAKAAWAQTGGRRQAQALAKEASNLQTLRTMQESRAVLNEVAGHLADANSAPLPALSPNSQAVVDRIAGPISTRAAAAKALDGQTAAVRDDLPVAITPSGQRVNVQPEIVDASTLVKASGALQVRNRSSRASAEQVEQIATNLDPARLMPSVDADSGAPIVGPDNMIDSGNGRVLAINRVYDAYPEKAKAYRDALVKAGYNIDGIERPVLINRRVTDLSPEARALFNADANAPRAAQMSAVELASMDRSALEGSLDTLDASPLSSAANRAFTKRFLANLPPSAKGALIDANGNLNVDGLRRAENALVALAYGDVDVGVLSRFAEAIDDNTRAIVGAMADVAGAWAKMRQAIKRGDISPEFDMTPELTEALRRIGGWREQAREEKRPVGMVIKEGMAQLDMLSGEISPETQAMIAAFYKTNAFTQAQGRDTIATLLGRMVNAAEELGKPQLFDVANVDKLEIIQRAAVNEQGNLFTPIGAVDGIEADGVLDRGAADAADRQGDRRAVEAEQPSLAAEPPADFPIGAGSPFRFLRNTASLSAETPAEFGQDVEPAGRYMNFDEIPNSATREGWERGQVEFARPLFLRVGSDDYTSPENWKRRLSSAYGGLTGEALSRAIASDGFDGVVTFDKYGPSEIVDLAAFRPDPEPAAADPAPSIGAPVSLKSLPAAQQKTVGDAFVATQPARSLDELYDVAPGNQATLSAEGKALGEKYGAEFKNPGLKKKETTAEKMVRKDYATTSQLTDVVRGGFLVNKPGQVDSIIADLSQRYRVLDEGWRMTEAGYFDRKASVQFDDGTIGEIQFWYPDLLEAKNDRGHALYEEMRTTTDKDRRKELLEAQRQIYIAAIDRMTDEEWAPVLDQLLDEVGSDIRALSGSPASGNISSKISADTGTPESMTSANDTSFQTPSDLVTAQARPSSVTAGLRSQSKNLTADTPVANVGSKASLVNDTVDDAAARVGKDESLRELALAHGVDPVTGDFAEAADVAQIREEGRLTADDEAELAAADEALEIADAYGRALDAARSCVV